MDPKYLAEIKAREQAAMPGPWEYECFGRYEDHDECILKTGTDECEISAKEDAEFIAHARTDIPVLIAEVERLTKFCDEWCSGEDQYQETVNKLDCARSDLAAKDQQIAMLEKALGLACERIAEYAFCGGTDAMKQKHAKKNIQHFIQQAQEQEADHA